jgi:hypothetical protein
LSSELARARGVGGIWDLALWSGGGVACWFAAGGEGRAGFPSCDEDAAVGELGMFGEGWIKRAGGGCGICGDEEGNRTK